jgi:uncharacterized protein
MCFGAVGDVHGDFDALDDVMARHPEIVLWLCPGDLASDSGEYPRPRAPLYWIKGNNEDFNFVASQPEGSGTIPHLHYIPNGASITAGGLTLAGLGGTFAPTWYERSPADLAAASRTTRAGRGAPASKDDKRRHFVRQEVEACRKLGGVDVFLSHEAPRPFPLETASISGIARRIDAGKTPVNEVLKDMHPRLHLFGHHHKYSVAERQGVPSICLEMVSESYLIFDGKTLAHQRMKT